MKRSILFLLAICFLAGTDVNAQGLLKKVSKSMSDELLGKTNNSSANKSNQPEPASACEKAELIMDMGGKLMLDYTELTISISEDGRILAKDLHIDNYYIVENGVTTGPFKPGDKRLKGFESAMTNDAGSDSDSDTKTNPWEGNPYITKSGDKFLITFGGKSYGPYAQISSFKVTKSKDKFAAVTIENIVFNADQAKAVEKAIENARTDQEKMDLAIKYSTEMAQKMDQGGGPNSMQAKLITNIPGATLDPNLGGFLNNSMKFDEILVNSYENVQDLKGNTIITIAPEQQGAEEIFVSSDNSRYAWYSSGTLAFSDKTTLPELFNPALTRVDGKIYLAYMYYSPKKNSILQCKIPF